MARTEITYIDHDIVDIEHLKAKVLYKEDERIKVERRNVDGLLQATYNVVSIDDSLENLEEYIKSKEVIWKLRVQKALKDKREPCPYIQIPSRVYNKKSLEEIILEPYRKNIKENKCMVFYEEGLFKLNYIAVHNPDQDDDTQGYLKELSITVYRDKKENILVFETLNSTDPRIFTYTITDPRIFTYTIKKKSEIVKNNL